jgi:predicted alpha/beta hydrolase family esterase
MRQRIADHAGGPAILTVPGLGGSGPSHWQTLWELPRPDTSRAELGMWSTPHRNSWVTKLDRAIATTRAPVILAAHSLGCLAVAWWATLGGQPYGWPVVGALLVAPPDVDAAGAATEIAGFAPAPRVPLPFPSILVASRDDPWVAFERAHSMAADWGSHFVDAGEQGHLNADSGLGAWREGQALLDLLLLAAGGSAGETRTPDAARAILGAVGAGLPSLPR